ncbi:hypothetical protein AB0A77_06630 [Streptomyces varsoviensis]|uniref:hypothetical protein n=1 Tax=Streptomyces varsoviensis TaxID=67373 RepID=UPI0033F5B11A
MSITAAGVVVMAFGALVLPTGQGAAVLAAASPKALGGSLLFTSPGQFTVPTGVRQVDVFLWGAGAPGGDGGGGGGGGESARVGGRGGAGGGGGGGGADGSGGGAGDFVHCRVSVTPGESFDVAPGAGTPGGRGGRPGAGGVAGATDEDGLHGAEGASGTIGSGTDGR